MELIYDLVLTLSIITLETTQFSFYRISSVSILWSTKSAFNLQIARNKQQKHIYHANIFVLTIDLHGLTDNMGIWGILDSSPNKMKQ
jgi:hypothetical protein